MRVHEQQRLHALGLRTPHALVRAARRLGSAHEQARSLGAQLLLDVVRIGQRSGLSGTGGRGGDSSQADLRDALVGAGIPVAYFEVTTFDDYERLMRTFTDITGRADLYDQNVAKVAEAIDAIVGAAPAENPPTALLLTTFSGGTRVQNSGTQTGAMLADLGVNNLADENRSLLKDFSLEAVIEMDPDFIFVIPMGNDTEAAMRNLEEATAANPAWASLSAVQNGRYITLDPTLYLAKPNAQWDAAYQGLFDNLYGQN